MRTSAAERETPSSPTTANAATLPNRAAVRAGQAGSSRASRRPAQSERAASEAAAAKQICRQAGRQQAVKVKAGWRCG